MYIIKNLKTNKLYKCKYPIISDTLRMLHARPFIKAGAMTEEESRTDTLCIVKFPFIRQIKKVDGRMRETKSLEWFTWLVVLK